MVKAQSPKPSTAVSCRARLHDDVLHTNAGKSIAISRRRDDEESGLSHLIGKLKSVVPTLEGKQKQELTDLEIMQHAINYIYDLSSVLQSDYTEVEEIQEPQEEIILPNSNYICHTMDSERFINSNSHSSGVQQKECRSMSAPVC